MIFFLIFYMVKLPLDHKYLYNSRLAALGRREGNLKILRYWQKG